MHDELDGDIWEAIIAKTIMEEIPVNIIKGFL